MEIYIFSVRFSFIKTTLYFKHSKIAKFKDSIQTERHMFELNLK